MRFVAADGGGRSTPTLGYLRRARYFLKAVAVTVTVAFLGLTLQPLAVAANLPAQNPPDARAATNDEKLARTLEDIGQRLAKLEEKLDRKLDAKSEKDDLKRLRTELDTLDRQALADFDAIERHLKDKNLPQVILNRHTEAVKQYQKEMATLKANLDELEKAPKRSIGAHGDPTENRAQHRGQQGGTASKNERVDEKLIGQRIGVGCQIVREGKLAWNTQGLTQKAPVEEHQRGREAKIGNQGGD